MFKKICVIALTLLVTFSIPLVHASNPTTTKTKDVSYGSQCTGRITDKATVNPDSLDWSFSLSGKTVKAINGYTFAKPYSNGVTYTNARKTADHSIGYYFYNSLGNNVGGKLCSINFTFDGSNSIS